MKTANELRFLISDVQREVCPLSAGAGASARRKHAKDLEATERHCRRFAALMESDAPFETVDDAIMALAPIAVWFIGWAARQLAILVIKAIWRRWTNSQPPLA